MMSSIRLALVPFLLSVSAVQAGTPDNVSSRLMIHVSAELLQIYNNSANLVVPELAYVDPSTYSTRNTRRMVYYMNE